MNQLRACLSVSGAFLLAALFGIAPPVQAQQDASRATPPPGKALVFVFRSEREPVAGQVPVYVNLARVGELANGTFVVATVNPGRTFLRIGDQVLSMSTLEAVANQSYFVRVDALPGVKPLRTEMRLVSEIDGRRALAQSRLVGPAPAAVAGAPRAQPPAAPIAAPPRPKPPAPPVAAAPRVQQPSPPARPAPKPAPRAAPPAEPDSGWELALIASTGVFKMANGAQTVAGLPSTFDKTSQPVLSIEAEMRNQGGFAVGGELFYFKNDLVANGTTLNAQQQVIAFMGNGKYYFRAADRLYPFVGAGIGFASASYSGNLTGSSGGMAYQGLVGIEYRFESVGVRVEYRYLAATAGKSGSDVKVGGSGILAGVSFTF
jgi:opacity protein-like surface antigen